MKFLEYHRSKIHNDKREACTRVPHARLDAVPRLVAAPYMTSDNGHYGTHDLALRNAIRTWRGVRAGHERNNGWCGEADLSSVYRGQVISHPGACQASLSGSTMGLARQEAGGHLGGASRHHREPAGLPVK